MLLGAICCVHAVADAEPGRVVRSNAEYRLLGESYPGSDDHLRPDHDRYLLYRLGAATKQHRVGPIHQSDTGIYSRQPSEVSTPC